MSYINEALKKAQRDRDSRYERFGGIIASGPARKEKPFKRKFAIRSALALLVLIPTGLLIAVYFLQQPSSSIQGSTPSVGRGSDETVSAAGSKEKNREFQGQREEAEVRYKEALSAQRGGDHKRAESLYQQALTLDPGHVRALNNLGVLFMDQKKKREAVALFDKAIVLKKDYVDPYYNLACVYARMDENDESIRYLKMAMAINKDVIQWAEKDADMKSVVASAAFKKIMEGQ